MHNIGLIRLIYWDLTKVETKSKPTPSLHQAYIQKSRVIFIVTQKNRAHKIWASTPMLAQNIAKGNRFIS